MPNDRYDIPTNPNRRTKKIIIKYITSSLAVKSVFVMILKLFLLLIKSKTRKVIKRELIAARFVWICINVDRK